HETRGITWNDIEVLRHVVIRQIAFGRREVRPAGDHLVALAGLRIPAKHDRPMELIVLRGDKRAAIRVESGDLQPASYARRIQTVRERAYNAAGSSAD